MANTSKRHICTPGISSRKLSKKRRFQIYARMLEHYSLPGSRGGFCRLIDTVTNRIDLGIDCFPELMKYKPKRNYRVTIEMADGSTKLTYTGYWWSPKNRERRALVLKKILGLHRLQGGAKIKELTPSQLRKIENGVGPTTV